MNITIKKFCQQKGIPRPFAIEPIRSGRNSSVFHVTHCKKHWVIKNYFVNKVDKRNRLDTEYQFLNFLNKAGSQLVAKPLGYDEKNQFALYSYLKGSRPKLITDEHIDQAANFIISLYELSGHSTAKKLDNAADACFNLEDHLNLVDDRLLWLESIDVNCSESEACLNWLKKILIPSWLKIKKEIITHALDLSRHDLTLSPSDFGFHNSLEYHGQLCFVDFEYAGWDSIQKLACDFICQPELPITVNQERKFVTKLALDCHIPHLVHQVQLLLPIHRIKWCCILLNIFREVDRQRRIHADAFLPDSLSMQLNKAKWYFAAHLEYSC